MPSIKPFNGIIYNPAKVRDFAKVVAPPYDVIPPPMQRKLHRSSPCNIVRLTLGRIREGDDAKDNRYTRAAKLLKDWVKTAVLLRDKKRTLYVYAQEYMEDGRAVRRIGFIALLELPKKGSKSSVLPHENTLLAPKLDRLNLIRATSSNLEPIFALYEDAGHRVLDVLKNAVRKEKPFIDIRFNGARNSVWRIEDPRLIRRITAGFRAKDIFIADGHHRYEVSVTYSMEVNGEKAAPPGLRRNSRYIMAYFVEMNDDMLTILPTHRLVKDLGILKRHDIYERVSKFFRVERVPTLKALLTGLRALQNSCAFGMYLGKRDFLILKLKDRRDPERLIKNNSNQWKTLDVTVLHLFLLECVLGVRDDEDNIVFVKDAKEAATAVDRAKFKMALFLNPTKISQLRDVARLGERMPRKATYFHPKPLSGLVINKMY